MSASASSSRTGQVWHAVDGAQRWDLPDLGQGGPGRRSAADAPPSPPTAAEIAGIQEAARAEGYAEGHALGLAQGREAAAEELRALQAIVAQLARPLADLDAEVERALTNLALSLARRIVGHCIEAEAENLRQMVHRVVAHLGTLESTVDVELNPHDYARLNQIGELDRYWHLRANTSLSAGDVVVRQGDIAIDGRLLQRVERLAADMLDAG